MKFRDEVILSYQKKLWFIFQKHFHVILCRLVEHILRKLILKKSLINCTWQKWLIINQFRNHKRNLAKVSYKNPKFKI